MEEKEIGKITHYYGKVSVGIIELKEPLKLGDTIRVKGTHDDFTQKVDSMQIEHASIAEAKRGDEIGVKLIQTVHSNDKVYKVV